MKKAEVYNSPEIDQLMKTISPEEQIRVEKRMLLSARVDDGIKNMGWKKKDFAKAMGKTPSEITKWLSGTHNFTADTLFDIERVLGITLINLGGSVFKPAVYTWNVKSIPPIPFYAEVNEEPVCIFKKEVQTAVLQTEDLCTHQK